MKYQDLSQKNTDQLRKDLAELRGKAEQLAMKKKLGQVKNVHELAKVRKDIARILTYLRAN
jgi:ribosomal protein L29